MPFAPARIGRELKDTTRPVVDNDLFEIIGVTPPEFFRKGNLCCR
jgi:hypothetical protein